MTDAIVFLNGDFITEGKARIAPSDRGFTLGDGVFDTMLAVDGKPRHAARHFERLARHAAVLQIPVPAFDLENLAEQLLQKNGLQKGSCVLRTTLTRGPGQRGLTPPEKPEPTLIMRAAPAASAKSFKVMLAQTVRRNEHSPLSRIKSLNYSDNLLALMEARDKGFDDALMLNTQGHVVCGTIGNLFIEEKGKLITPPLADGALDGITRASLLESNGALEETLTPERVRKADAVYLTNSVTGVRAVNVLEDRVFRDQGARLRAG